MKKVILSRADENGIPLIPAKLKPRILGKTQLVKQADVVMLLVLLNDIFSLKTKIANYNFYIPRTVHKSSLSLLYTPLANYLFLTFLRLLCTRILVTLMEIPAKGFTRLL